MSATVEALPYLNWLLDSEGKRHSARYFLQHTQGGSLTGEAYVLFTQWHQGKSQLRFVRVAVCDHKMVPSRGADPMRGWHPSKCDKCGLDMSVDSSD